MDAYLAIVSKREVRSYADRPIDPDARRRILEAARISGSSGNKQQWRFIVVESEDKRARLAETVYVPGNVQGAKLIVVVVMQGGGRTNFDVGRTSQNMMLAAWNEGVVSCPNGVRDADAAERIVGARPAIVLSFGYPQRPREPESRSAEEWSRRANRRPLDDVTRRV
jgi:nitroreductase